jgi:hypothetical protein
MKIVHVARLTLFALLAAGCATRPPASAPATTPGTEAAPASAPTAPASQALAAPATPSAIAVASGQRVLLKASATGVQIYTCKPTESAPDAYEWTLKAPEADLFDDKGQKIGKHYGGPTWESTDGEQSHRKAPEQSGRARRDGHPLVASRREVDRGYGSLQQREEHPARGNFRWKGAGRRLRCRARGCRDPRRLRGDVLHVRSLKRSSPGPVSSPVVQARPVGKITAAEPG